MSAYKFWDTTNQGIPWDLDFFHPGPISWLRWLHFEKENEEQVRVPQGTRREMREVQQAMAVAGRAASHTGAKSTSLVFTSIPVGRGRPQLDAPSPLPIALLWHFQGDPAQKAAVAFWDRSAFAHFFCCKVVRVCASGIWNEQQGNKKTMCLARGAADVFWNKGLTRLVIHVGVQSFWSFSLVT